MFCKCRDDISLSGEVCHRLCYRSIPIYLNVMVSYVLFPARVPLSAHNILYFNNAC